jgi:hypothetical protein
VSAFADCTFGFDLMGEEAESFSEIMKRRSSSPNSFRRPGDILSITRAGEFQ